MTLENKSRRLKGRDLISIGIFSALYFVISLVMNMLGGFHTIVWYISPGLAAIVGAIPYMILNSKVKKPLGVLLMGVIVGLIYLITGMFFWTVPVFFVAGAVIAELLRLISKYNSFWVDAVGFVFFSMGMVGSPIALWINYEGFMQQIIDFGISESYIKTLESLYNPGMLILIFVVTAVCAILGVLLTRGLFKKHFKKAGIV